MLNRPKSPKILPCWRLWAACLALVFLLAPVGLAHHGSSHLHAASESGDCDLCLLGSHFFFESTTVFEPGSPDPVGFLSAGRQTLPPEADQVSSSARSPPAVFV